MNDELSTLKVTDRESFVRFTELLRQDFLENKEDWENRNLNKFLDAITRFSVDIQDYYDSSRKKVNADEPSWQTFADILKGATVYGLE